MILHKRNGRRERLGRCRKRRSDRGSKIPPSKLSTFDIIVDINHLPFFYFDRLRNKKRLFKIISASYHRAEWRGDQNLDRRTTTRFQWVYPIGQEWHFSSHLISQVRSFHHCWIDPNARHGFLRCTITVALQLQRGWFQPMAQWSNGSMLTLGPLEPARSSASRASHPYDVNPFVVEPDRRYPLRVTPDMQFQRHAKSGYLCRKLPICSHFHPPLFPGPEITHLKKQKYFKKQAFDPLPPLGELSAFAFFCISGLGLGLGSEKGFQFAGGRRSLCNVMKKPTRARVPD